MLQKMWDYMEQFHMIEEEDVVLVGCSGGADSVALMLALKELSQKIPFSMLVVHVEHGIRGEESILDQQFVENLCRAQEVPYETYCVDVKKYANEHHLGIEEAARKLRYDAFYNCSKAQNKPVKLALAHHLEDNAETILFQMARGSGIVGLCGMQSVRKEEAYTIIRPLLCVERAEIEEYLCQRNQAFCTDSTNSDISYSRNRIRKELLPQLEKVNSKAVAHINQSAKQLFTIYDYIRQNTDAAFKDCFYQERAVGYLAIDKIKELHPAIATEVVRKIIIKMSGRQKDILSVHVGDVIALCEKQTGSKLSLPYGLECQVEYERICFYHVAKSKTQELYIEVGADVIEELLHKEEKTIALGKDQGLIRLTAQEATGNPEEIVKKTYTKILDYDKMKDGFVIRNRRSKDFFVINFAGNKKKLADYFVDEKIPQKDRDHKVLIARGQEIVWLIGGRIGANYKVTSDTKHYLIIEYVGGDEDGLQCKA